MREFGKIGTGPQKFYLAAWSRATVREIAADFAAQDLFFPAPLQMSSAFLEGMDGSEVLFRITYDDRYNVYDLSILGDATHSFRFHERNYEVTLVNNSRKVVFD